MHEKIPLFSKLLCIGLLAGAQARAETIYYAFDNVFFQKEGTPLNLAQMHGYFSWTYTAGDFENGTGTLIYVDIPGTVHGVEDLIVTIETGGLEISLDGSFHDDGVDVSLKFLTDLSPSAPSAIDTDPESSKFDIGGNGFYRGTIYSGSVQPFEFSISISQPTATSVQVNYTPDYSWCVLRESEALTPSNWSDAATGNPLDVSISGQPKMFYQLTTP
ncbi:MAG: hypothetical protein ACSHX4_08145 [Opitutaceae bacterium]